MDSRTKGQNEHTDTKLSFHRVSNTTSTMFTWRPWDAAQLLPCVIESEKIESYVVSYLSYVSKHINLLVFLLWPVYESALTEDQSTQPFTQLRTVTVSWTKIPVSFSNTYLHEMIPENSCLTSHPVT